MLIRCCILLLITQPAFAVDFKFAIDVLECESSGEHRDRRGKIHAGDDGVSVGIAQFQEATFNEFKIRAGHPEWQWKNAVHQLRLMEWMIRKGYGRRWTCYRKLVGRMD